MNPSSTNESNKIGLIHAWIWEACVYFDFKKEVHRTENIIGDLDSLRKYYIDDKNTSLLLAIRKLENILDDFIKHENVLETLLKFQDLTIELLKDTKLHVEIGVILNLICFHRYSVLTYFEISGEHKGDILLPTLPLNPRQWEYIKDQFKFEDDIYKEDIIKTLKVFNRCKEGMASRVPNIELVLDYLSKIKLKLKLFSCELRKLLLTPTLVKIHEESIYYIFYKSREIICSDLILEEIRDHGVTRDSITLVLDMLLQNISQISAANAEVISPPIPLDPNVVFAYNKYNTSTVSGKTTSSPLSLNPIGSSVVKKKSVAVQVESSVKLTSESMDARENTQVEYGVDSSVPESLCSEKAVSGSLRARKTLSQNREYETLRSGVHTLANLLKDAEKVSENLGILKTAATRVANSCSGFEKAYSDFLKLITTDTSKKHMKELFYYFNLEHVYKESENLCNVSKFCDSDSTIINSTFLEEESSKVVHDLNDDNMSVDSERSMPVLTPEGNLDISLPVVNLESKGKSPESLDKNSLPCLTPQKETSSKSNSTSVSPHRNRSTSSNLPSTSSHNETFEKTVLYEPGDVNNERKVSDNSSSQNMFVNPIEFDKNIVNDQFPEINEDNTEQELDVSSHAVQMSFNNETDENNTLSGQSLELRLASFSSRLTPPNKSSDYEAAEESVPAESNSVTTEHDDEKVFTLSSSFIISQNETCNDVEREESILNTSCSVNEVTAKTTSLSDSSFSTNEQEINSFSFCTSQNKSGNDVESMLDISGFRNEVKTEKSFLSESSSSPNEDRKEITNAISSDCSPLIESCNNEERVKSNLNTSCSEHEEPTLDTSRQCSLQTKPIKEDNNLEINYLSENSDRTKISEDQPVKPSPSLGSQKKPFKEISIVISTLNESSSSKDKSIEKRTSGIYLQKSRNDDDDDNGSEQEDRTKALHSSSDYKLNSNPYVALTPLKDPTSSNGTSKHFDHQDKHPTISDDESLSTFNGLDKTNESQQMDSKPSTSRISLASEESLSTSRISLASEESPLTSRISLASEESPDNCQFVNLFKRRKLMDDDSSYSEDEF